MTKSEHPFSNELLSAYFDRELEGDELARVEQRLADDPQAQQQLQQWQRMRDDLQTLPRHQLGGAFTQRVLQQLQDQPEADQQPVSPSPDTDDRRRGILRGLIWAALTVATAVLLMVFQAPSDPQLGDEVAQAPATDAEVAATRSDDTFESENELRSDHGRRNLEPRQRFDEPESSPETTNHPLEQLKGGPSTPSVTAPPLPHTRSPSSASPGSPNQRREPNTWGLSPAPARRDWADSDADRRGGSDPSTREQSPAADAKLDAADAKLDAAIELQADTALGTAESLPGESVADLPTPPLDPNPAWANGDVVVHAKLDLASTRRLALELGKADQGMQFAGVAGARLNEEDERLQRFYFYTDQATAGGTTLARNSRADAEQNETLYQDGIDSRQGADISDFVPSLATASNTVVFAIHQDPNQLVSQLQMINAQAIRVERPAVAASRQAGESLTEHPSSKAAPSELAPEEVVEDGTIRDRAAPRAQSVPNDTQSITSGSVDAVSIDRLQAQVRQRAARRVTPSPRTILVIEVLEPAEGQPVLASPIE